MIAGASQGSGKATAILFASKGYDVVMVTRQPERLAANSGSSAARRHFRCCYWGGCWRHSTSARDRPKSPIYLRQYRCFG
ncbi:hypothetical protein QUA20_18030 [Microcoleus sp. Pol7_A1]|uniref:hypothetical protein n=1 Tax=Microcoleus sp. Pol7_A1 TaxID=2818893 RepID=UPI002FD54582